MALTKLNNSAISSVTNAGLPALDHTNVPAGSVLQTVSGTFTDVDHSSSSTSFIDIDSSLNVTITPKLSTSKLLLTGCVLLGIEDDVAPSIRILVNGSDVGSSTNAGSRGTGHTGMGYVYYTSRGSETYYEMFSFGINFLTSAVGTTSPIVCKPQYRNCDGSGSAIHINTSNYNGNVSWTSVGVSTLTVQEIKQ